MPCDGPSRELAHAEADKLYDDLMKTMKAECQFADDVRYPRDKDTADQADSFCSLRELLREIVWRDHAASF